MNDLTFDDKVDQLHKQLEARERDAMQAEQRLQCAPVPGVGAGAGDDITAQIKTPGTIARDDIVHSAAARRDCALASGSGAGRQSSSWCRCCCDSICSCLSNASPSTDTGLTGLVTR